MFTLRRRALHEDDDGFTLVEAMVALVIIFGLMVVLLRTFDSGTRILVETRRQAAASKLASELVERAQALEWQHMGLASSNNGADCVTEQIGCYVASIDGLSAIPGGYQLDGEEVVFANADTFAPFLSFHSNEERGGTNFDRYLFVTKIAGMDTTRRITAVVEWVPPEGFRKQVRLETIVSEYREPSQPLIGAEIFYSGGEFALDHRNTIDDGSLVDGTKGWSFSVNPFTTPAPAIIDFTSTPRPVVQGLILQPALRMTAVSDFVSGTDLQLTSANVAELKWAGTPANIPLPLTFLETTDDDASSLPPLNIDPVTLFAKSVDGYHYSGPGLNDLVVAEAQKDALLFEISEDPLNKSKTNANKWTAELWTQLLDGTVLEDELPLAKFQHALNGAPDKLVIGFTEFESSLVPFNEPRYDFTFFRRGINEKAYDLNVSLDRKNNSVTAERTIAGQLRFSGEEIRLFHDEAYPGKGSGKNAGFRGFVKILTPEIRIDQVVAGEGVLLSPTLTSVGDLVILVWDPTSGPSGGYVERLRKNYATLNSVCGSGTSDGHVDINITDSIRKAGHPSLDYSIVGALDINGWCSQTSTDALGNVSEASVLTKGAIVEGDLRYKVTDVWWREFFLANPGYVPGAWATYAPGEMTIFDVQAHFETDEMRVTTVFVDPNAG